jgi:hypothetical protein
MAALGQGAYVVLVTPSQARLTRAFLDRFHDVAELAAEARCVAALLARVLVHRVAV